MIGVTVPKKLKENHQRKSEALGKLFNPCLFSSTLIIKLELVLGCDPPIKLGARERRIEYSEAF